MKKHLFSIITLALLVTSCTKDDLALPYDDLLTGQKTTLHIALKEPSMNVVTRTGLTPEKEAEIQSVAIFIIDNTTNRLVTSVFHDNVTTHNYPTENLEVETLVGNNRNVYVIANYHANLIDQLKTVSTCEEAEALIAESYSNPLLREYGMAKTGKLTNINVRKNELITVQLEYIASKITTNVINKSPNFTVLGWGVGNLPILTYAFATTADALSNDDYYKDLEGQMMQFEVKPTINTPGNPDAPLNYSNTFYMYENRRGGRDLEKPTIPDGWPYGEPESKPRHAYQEKSWYAPKNATYIKIYGRWDDNGTPRDVVITHYLGENNHDDYNIYRATHYTYNIIIEHLNKTGNQYNITIDTNVSMKENHLSIITPAQLMNLDAHYCYRPITLNVQEVTKTGSKISIEVLESANSTVPSSWLDLSATFLFMHHVRDDGSTPTDEPRLAINTWLQNGEAWSYVRPKFVPNMQDRKTGGIAANYTPPPGLTIDMSNNDPTNILPDNDLVMEYKPQNYHRMVKKFIGLPTGVVDDPKYTTSPVHLILYAKEYPINDLNNPLAAAFREAVVRITLEVPGEPTEYTHFTVRQYPPYIFAQIGKEVLLVERVEEYALLMRPYIDINLQILGGMQWGNWDIPETEANSSTATNGFANTLLGVYKSSENQPVNNPNDYEGSNSGYNYRTPMYGSMQGTWDKTNNGMIKQGDANHFINKLQGQPYFSIPKNDYQNAVNINYNTTAARYCHEKNWDENGDGVIAGTEVKWYLPSLEEVQLFWTYHEALDLHSEYYWTSNQADANKAYALSMEHAQAEPHLLYNGVRQAYPKTLFSTINPPRVRCVRRVAASSLINNTPLTPLVYHTAAATIVDCSTLPGKMTTTESKLGITQANPGALQRANEKVYKKLEIQRTQAVAPVNYVKLHFEQMCNASQGWRLPTQRELLIIYSVRDKLEANSSATGFHSFVNGTYWSMIADLSKQYLVEFGNNGMATIDNASENKKNYYYRCVREIN